MKVTASIVENPKVAELDAIAKELEAAAAEYELQVEAGKVAERKLGAVRAALAALRGDDRTPARAAAKPLTTIVAAARRKAKPQRIPSTKQPRAPKASKAKRSEAKPPKETAAPKRLAPDEPRVAKGRLPTVGVEQLVCESEAQRRAKVNELRDAGYLRVGPGHPLTPGRYDVRDTPDGAVVIWRPKAEGSE